MAFEETPTVDEGTLYYVLAELRRVRKWSVDNHGDPWAFRQAMITILDIDTITAFESGVTAGSLARFDSVAHEKAREFIDSIPKEVGVRGR